jgi:hypothetical protein
LPDIGKWLTLGWKQSKAYKDDIETDKGQKLLSRYRAT